MTCCPLPRQRVVTVRAFLLWKVAVANASRHSASVPSDTFSTGRRCKLGLNIYTDGTPSAPAAQSFDPKQASNQVNEQKEPESPSSSGGGGAAGGSPERSTPAPSRTQLIQVLDASSSSLAGSGPGIALTFNDFFAGSGTYVFVMLARCSNSTPFV